MAVFVANTNSDHLDSLARRIIGAAIKVHRELGPGLLESCYEACLAYELSALGLRVERQKLVPVNYREITLDCGYRVDLLVEGTLIVEIKSVEQLAAIHQAQVISYLRLSKLSLALLINLTCGC